MNGDCFGSDPLQSPPFLLSATENILVMILDDPDRVFHIAYLLSLQMVILVAQTVLVMKLDPERGGIVVYPGSSNSVRCCLNEADTNLHPGG